MSKLIARLALPFETLLEPTSSLSRRPAEEQYTRM